MKKMTDELKETIIRDHPDGIWLVLAEENPPDIVTAHDLLCGTPGAKGIPFPQPTSIVNRRVSAPILTDRIPIWDR